MLTFLTWQFSNPIFENILFKPVKKKQQNNCLIRLFCKFWDKTYWFIIIFYITEYFEYRDKSQKTFAKEKNVWSYIGINKDLKASRSKRGTLQNSVCSSSHWSKWVQSTYMYVYIRFWGNRHISITQSSCSSNTRATEQWSSTRSKWNMCSKHYTKQFCGF
jgi:hypothetical protein